MNTKAECNRLITLVSERFGLDPSDIIELQAEQAMDYLVMWNFHFESVIAYSDQELEVFAQTKEFRNYWSQIWANTDRKLLMNTSPLDIKCMETNGTDMLLWYAIQHNYKGASFSPNSVIMEAFEKQLQGQLNAMDQLQSILNQ